MKEKYSKHKTKRFFLRDAVSTWAIIIIVLILCVLLYQLLQFGFDIRIINVAVAFALLFLTYIYITKTDAIINESVIERKKTFIEKKIEKLYALLISNKNLLQLTYENFNLIKTYQHLASDDLKPLLKEYIELFDNEAKNVSTEHGEALSLKHINPKFQEKIRTQIREDYEGLVEKLYNIHK